MFIQIPSKKIYSIDNPKIRNNPIDKIEVNASKVNTLVETDVQVYSEITDEVGGLRERETARQLNYGSTSSGVPWAYAYSSYAPQYATIYIDIPQSYDGKVIERLYTGKTDEGKPQISVSITAHKYESPITQNIRVNSAGSYFIGDIEYNDEDVTYQIVRYSTTDLSRKVGNEVTYSNATAIANINHTDETAIPYSVNFNPLTGIYSIAIRVLVGTEIVKLGGHAFVSRNTSGFDILATGTASRHYAKTLEISVNGDIRTIELQDSLITVGSSIGKNIFSVENNEFLQTTNYYQSQDTSAITYLFGETLKHYKNGKETAIIRTSIGEYYYDNGNLAISTKQTINGNTKMCFDVGDIVVPMIYGADGKDRPMSLYRDGTPKMFRVCGTKIYYDGAVWQELSLQEV